MAHSGRSSGPSEVPSCTSPRALNSSTKHATRSSNAIQRAAVLVISVLVALLAAVGVSATDPVAAQAEGGDYVKKCGGGQIFLNVKEKETFVLHNQIRRDRDIRALCVHPILQKAARAHSKDMIERNYFSHNTRAGTRPSPSASRGTATTIARWARTSHTAAVPSGSRGA
jgi:uncharacterized protein YkwD